MKYKVQLIRVDDKGNETPVGEVNGVEPSFASDKTPYFNTAQGEELAEMCVTAFHDEITTGWLNADLMMAEQHVNAVKFHQSFGEFSTYEEAEADMERIYREQRERYS